MSRLSTILLIALTLPVISVLAACNTISGMGEDVASGGHAVERAADSAK